MNGVSDLVASAYADFQKEIAAVTEAYQLGLQEAAARHELRLRAALYGEQVAPVVDSQERTNA